MPDETEEIERYFSEHVAERQSEATAAALKRARASVSVAWNGCAALPAKFSGGDMSLMTASSITQGSGPSAHAQGQVHLLPVA